MLPFAVGAYAAFVAHVGVDWDWEMPVVILCGLFCAAAILLAGRGETTVGLPDSIRYGAVGVIAVAAVLAFVGIIGNGALASAQTAQSDGNLAAAERDARKATTWLPWSESPTRRSAISSRRVESWPGLARASARRSSSSRSTTTPGWVSARCSRARRGAGPGRRRNVSIRSIRSTSGSSRPAAEDNDGFSPYAEKMGGDPLGHPAPLIRRVYAYVAYRIGAGAEAEDITSDAFERALRYRSTYDPSKGTPQSWLLGIARSCIADHFAHTGERQCGFRGACDSARTSNTKRSSA